MRHIGSVNLNCIEQKGSQLGWYNVYICTNCICTSVYTYLKAHCVIKGESEKGLHIYLKIHLLGISTNTALLLRQSQWVQIFLNTKKASIYRPLIRSLYQTFHREIHLFLLSENYFITMIRSIWILHIRVHSIQ